MAARCLALALACALFPIRAQAADLTDAAIRAYDAYLAGARRDFVERARSNSPHLVADSNDPRTRRGVAQPGSGDGILSHPDSLVHHWRGEIFLPDTTLDAVIGLSQGYADYPRIFRPIRAATVLPPSGDAVNVLFRMRASGGGLSATLDVRTRSEWVRVDERRAYVVSTSQEIREVKDAGRPGERLLPAGHDSGYLWRAATMTRFLADGGGVWMAMETVGLSRPFPMMLGWMIEPIARRVGRGSVEQSMQEFAHAVAERGKLAP